MPVITTDDLKEEYRVTCECGWETGQIDERDAAEGIKRDHSDYCDCNTQVTPGTIPGHE